MSPRHLIPALAVSLICACSSGNDAANKLIAQLHTDFQPGLSTTRAQELLTASKATFSVRSAAECNALVSEARTSVNLAPQGGPCIFGKIPVSQTWYGGHTDVILQLVFTPDGKMADGNFEAIESSL
jgi:hypothetical protein